MATIKRKTVVQHDTEFRNVLFEEGTPFQGGTVTVPGEVGVRFPTKIEKSRYVIELTELEMRALRGLLCGSFISHMYEAVSGQTGGCPRPNLGAVVEREGTLLKLASEFDAVVGSEDIELDPRG